MDDYWKCTKCNEEDQEGQFCRCEDRNIRIAKEKRRRNDGPRILLLPKGNLNGQTDQQD